MLYKIKQELKWLLYKNICIETPLFTSTPLFPLKRESMLTLDLKWIPACAGMTDKKEEFEHA